MLKSNMGYRFIYVFAQREMSEENLLAFKVHSNLLPACDQWWLLGSRKVQETADTVPSRANISVRIGQSIRSCMFGVTCRTFVKFGAPHQIPIAETERTKVQ